MYSAEMIRQMLIDAHDVCAKSLTDGAIYRYDVAMLSEFDSLWKQLHAEDKASVCFSSLTAKTAKERFAGEEGITEEQVAKLDNAMLGVARTVNENVTALKSAADIIKRFHNHCDEHSAIIEILESLDAWSAATNGIFSTKREK